MSNHASVGGKVSSGLTRSSAQLPSPNSLGEHVCVQREAKQPAVEPGAADLVRGVVESPGRPLDAETRAEMEPRFNQDFSRVRVHTDAGAAQSAQAVNANAYTAGSHIVFDSGRYSPASPSGQSLMAHELTHVVQQASGPVAATEVADGLAVSHPSDAFERAAREASSGGVSTGDHTELGGAAPHVGAAPFGGDMTIQRADTSPDGQWMARQTAASETSASAAQSSASAGWLSAAAGVGSAAAGVVSAFEAVRQANFAERAAETAEDPPTPEPTNGGVVANHVELTEVKGIHTQPYDDTTVTTENTTSMSDPTLSHRTVETSTTSKQGPKNTTIKDTVSPGARSTNEEAKLTTTKVKKDADTPDEERTLKLLSLREGAANSAEFSLVLRFNGKDVRGGATEDGDIGGYLGGSNASNATVNFRASPGKPGGDGVATERVLFGGTNVPPRKTIKTRGFWEIGSNRSVNNPDYKIQRFSGSIRVTGEGKVVPKDTVVHCNPTSGDSTHTLGDGNKTALVAIHLNSGASASTNANQSATSTPVTAAGPTAPPSGNTK
jgi:hypothetical protein